MEAALNELAHKDAELAQIVEMRFFGGVSRAEIGAARVEFLDTACAGDAELRGEEEELLSASARTDELTPLTPGLARDIADTADGETPKLPERIGPAHRDLKPENILIDGDGNPKVIDFGVALALETDDYKVTRLTGTGQLLGTLAYMSPEQFGEGDVDTRSDIYSLGVCLYELLTDSLPLEVSGKALPEAARCVQHEPPVVRGNSRATGGPSSPRPSKRTPTAATGRCPTWARTSSASSTANRSRPATRARPTPCSCSCAATGPWRVPSPSCW